MNNKVAAHYTLGSLGPAIEAGLEATVGSSRAVTIDDLAPVDEFHIGGRPASIHLFDQMGLSSADSVLDIGAGIGGSSRFVAQTYGSSVEGIDLTPEFCEVGNSLNKLVGLDDRVNITEGSALDMPFADNSFSAAYMMHVGMNISDKPALYSEVRRVLKPGGTFAIYDVLQGPNGDTLDFPVPWATTQDASFLATAEQMTNYLEDAGFTVDTALDRTEFAVEFFKSIAVPAGGTPPPLGLRLIIGNDAPLKISNMVKNIGDGRCGPWEFMAR
jgi:ubiquinone/menaquinone biosynthesis C-methylase UbiE